MNLCIPRVNSYISKDYIYDKLCNLQIPIPKENKCVEHLWAKTSFFIPDDRTKIMLQLGINIAPASHNFYLI